MAFGSRLRQARESRWMTQEELAERSGIVQSYLSALEREKQMPTLAVAVQLARVLGVSLDWLCELPVRNPGQLTPDEESLLRYYRQLPSDLDRLWALGTLGLQPAGAPKGPANSSVGKSKTSST